MYSRDEIEARNRSQVASEVDPFSEDRYRQFARFISAGWVVLDVGCNTGRGGAALKAEVPDIQLDGVDLLSERLEAIPADIYRDLYSESLEELAHRGKAYDAILAGEVVEHVPYAQLDEFIAGLLGLAKPGGLLMLTTPNPHSWVSRLRGRTVLGGAHVSIHCAEALSELFLFHGAKECRVHGSGKSSRFVGTRMPRGLYGSYLILVSV
jgi:2-polyprenyl-3-methyl-5-hydroxy-6-metoxy-1,4-benzoquinol methylase